MSNVLVTGASGQLGSNLKSIANAYPSLNLIFKNSEELNIVNIESINRIFKETKIDYCINCAAYTAVDGAEDDKETAFLINDTGVKNLANTCSIHNVVLIHISTDFVFDGDSSKAYNESDITNPINAYGLSKLKGEKSITEIVEHYFIIRTSWLYSEYNNNFMKTMISLSESRDSLSVVDDQIGTPTYAKDLAKLVLKIVSTKNSNYGLYHYSNEGVASWYDFAVAIFCETKKDMKINPVKSKDFITSAKRPSFSLLDKSKIKEVFDIDIPHWRYSLKSAISNFDIVKS